MSSSETTNPLIVWQRLRTGNDHLHAPSGRRDEPASDRQVAAVFGCSDSGLCGQQVFGQSRGSLIDVMNWGHVIDSGVIATLEYAVESREVPLIVVLGHQDCDAIRTAMQAWSDAVLPGGATRTVVEHVIGSIVRRGTEAESADAVAAAHIVETGLALLERSPVIARRVNAQKCGIVCARTNSADGRISVLATVGAVGEPDGSLLECV